MRRQVDEFVFDDDNEDKFWAHGLTAVDVRQVLDRPRLVKRNRKHRRGAILVIGRNAHGRCIAIPAEPTHDPFAWRPITAWPCKPSEESQCP